MRGTVRFHISSISESGMVKARRRNEAEYHPGALNLKSSVEFSVLFTLRIIRVGNFLPIRVVPREKPSRPFGTRRFFLFIEIPFTTTHF
jgi:hypothetical protein